MCAKHKHVCQCIAVGHFAIDAEGVEHVSEHVDDTKCCVSQVLYSFIGEISALKPDFHLVSLPLALYKPAVLDIYWSVVRGP